jgi:predicted glycoside hydrolase/deacetylase ChbG (UPF0249 family)
MRQLIVNADDFGQSTGINRGVIEAHQKGIVTSASLMVRWPGAEEAADYARRHSGLSVGLHVDLAEWKFSDGVWTKLYEVVPPGDGAAVRDEVERQLDTFRNLVGREPTHLDSHQHLHREEPLYSILCHRAEELGIPCRGYSPIQYCGRFYGQTHSGQPLLEAISVEALMKILIALPRGTTELGCHPGFGIDGETMYRQEREQELQTLCDGRLRAVLEQEKIGLLSFSEWSRESGTSAVLTGGFGNDQ